MHPPRHRHRHRRCRIAGIAEPVEIAIRSGTHSAPGQLSALVADAVPIAIDLAEPLQMSHALPRPSKSSSSWSPFG
jgi:hypothetical protein